MIDKIKMETPCPICGNYEMLVMHQMDRKGFLIFKDSETSKFTLAKALRICTKCDHSEVGDAVEIPDNRQDLIKIAEKMWERNKAKGLTFKNVNGKLTYDLEEV